MNLNWSLSPRNIQNSDNNDGLAFYAEQYFKSECMEIIKTTHNHARYVTGHMIKSSRLSPCFSGEEPGYEARLYSSMSGRWTNQLPWVVLHFPRGPICQQHHPHPVGAIRVYRAKPILSLTGSWGRGVRKSEREGLADVISIHELLTNELLISHPLIGTQKHHVQQTLNVVKMAVRSVKPAI